MLPGGLAGTLPDLPRETPFVIVAGAGRSGTSAVARVLHEGGIRMGADFDEPTTFNSTGYFQERAVYVVNEELLAALGMSALGGSTKLPWRATVLAVAEEFRDRLAAIGASDTDGWKDPIFSLTLEAWLPHLPTRPKIVACLRSPAAYAESVRHIFGLVDQEAAERQWANHYRRLLRVIRDYRLEATCVEYNALVEQPEETVQGLARFVGRPLDASHVDPGLRRYEAPVPERYAELYASVRTLAPDAPRSATGNATASKPRATLGADEYVARSDAVSHRARHAYAEWAAQVAMPALERSAAAREATASCSAALQEAQREIEELVPPPVLADHFALTKRQIDVQRMVAECALAVLSRDPPDPQMEKATEESWQRFGHPAAIERLEEERQQALRAARATA